MQLSPSPTLTLEKKKKKEKVMHLKQNNTTTFLGPQLNLKKWKAWSKAHSCQDIEDAELPSKKMRSTTVSSGTH